jgi:RND family efflux transporter MFP subunit
MTTVQKMHNTFSKLYLSAAAGFSFIALAGCGSGEVNKKEKEAHVPAPAAIEAVQVKKQQLTSLLQIPGELIAFQQVDIYAKVSSFVKKVHADVGTQVSQGQLLATMEAPEIGSQLSGAESKLNSFEAIYLASKANYERLLETSKTPGTISPNELDLALAKQKSDYAQLQAAKAAYHEVTDNKRYLEIRAPFSGIITSRNANPGAYAGPSGKGSELSMFTVQEQKKLRLVIAVPEAYSSYLHNNSEVKFSVKALPSQVFTAKVTRLAGALDAKLRSQRIEMDVANADKKLLPGMVADVSLPLNSKDSSLTAPRSSVLNASTGTFVIRVNGNKAEWVVVQKGNEANGNIELFGKINAGDTIIKAANEEIRDHADVRIKLKN